METIEQADIGLDTGIAGDWRGIVKPGGRGRRQVSLMLLDDWRAALAELGDPPLAWSDRRANLLVDGIVLPMASGGVVRIGSALFEITGECDPCRRMEAVAVGLEAALMDGWRGGRLMRVTSAGAIAIGDAVSVEAGNGREMI